MECLLSYLCMVTVPHIMVGLERMSDYTHTHSQSWYNIPCILYQLIKISECFVLLKVDQQKLL